MSRRRIAAGRTITCLALFASTFAARVAAAPTTFQFGPFPVGTAPRGVAIADFNGDSKPDIVCANGGSQSFSLLLNGGFGAMQASIQFSVKNVPRGIVAADLNGDGDVDVATSHFTSTVTEQISVRFGNGNGSFIPNDNFTSGGTFASYFAAGPLNGDGRLDLVIPNHASSNVGIQIANSGNPMKYGTTPPVLPVSSPPESLLPHTAVLGDLNGDGKLDFIVSHESKADATVRLGDGAGGFGAASLIATGVASAGLALGDLDGDGKLDLVIGSIAGNQIARALGSGSGTFGAPALLPAGSAPEHVRVADLDSNGTLDVAALNAGSNDVSVLLNSGGAAFTGAAGSPFACGFAPGGIAIGDLNGDSRPDFVVTNTTANTVTFLAGDGVGWKVPTVVTAGPFTPRFTTPSLLTAGQGPRDVVQSDLDGDGRLDLAVASFNSNDASVLLNLGAGAGFAAPSSYPVGTAPRSIGAGDFNTDGKPDLITANSTASNVS